MIFRAFIVGLNILCTVLGAELLNSGNLDVNTMGDHFEKGLIVGLSCRKNPKRYLVEGQIKMDFEDCRNRTLVSGSDRDFRTHTDNCANRLEYFKCWERLNSQLAANCDPSWTNGLYESSFSAWCDLSEEAYVKYQESLQDLENESAEAIDRATTSAAGNNACAPYYGEILSRDLCTRHSGIGKCGEALFKAITDVTGKDFFAIKLINRIHQDSRAYLKCSDLTN